MQWKTEAGPIQTKRVQKALSAYRWHAQSVVELSGVIGGEERRCTMTPMCGGMCDGAQEALDAIGERYSWVITGENHKRIIGEIESAQAALELPIEDNRITPEQDAENREAARKRDDARREAASEANAAWAAILAKRPPRAEALIVAEQEIDDCDSMTDYYATKTGRRVAIGWRTGKREDFRQLRKAAAGFEPTKHLGPGCDVWTARLVETGTGQYRPFSVLHGQSFTTEAEAWAAIEAEPETWAGCEWKVSHESVEHRDNYSMGAGNYLKAEGRYGSGWAVRSHRIGESSPYLFEDALPEAEDEPETVAEGIGYTIEQHHHTKRGTDIYIVVLTDRVDRPVFEALRASAKHSGGWYSRAWHGSPGGFAFDRADLAATWAKGALGGQTPPDGGEPLEYGQGKAAAERFRETAQKARDSAARMEAPRRENTPKQRKQAASARFEAANLRHGARACDALANAWEAGTIPAELRSITPAKARNMMAKRRDHSREGYYDVIPTDDYADSSDDAQAVQAFADSAGGDAPNAAELAKRTEAASVVHEKIPGFFPTPHNAARVMAELAMPAATVLEPSAGRGDLADALRNTGAVVDIAEINPRLRAMLEARQGEQADDGTDHPAWNIVGDDFMEMDPPPIGYGAVVMNPPFEKRQDQKHIRHAWEFVKDGGRLVALCSPGAINGQSQGFREWLDEIGADYSGRVGGFEATKVEAVLIVAEK